MIRRFFIALVVGFVCMFGTTVSYACTTDEIDVLGDGTNCQTAKFTLTTTEIAADGTFQFYMSAKGTFYVDCGAGGTLSSSASDVSGKTITRSNTTGATYTCTYSTAGIKMISFGGLATGYGDSFDSSAIVFADNLYVARISGSLGAIFPTVGTSYPRFYRTFANCTNLTGSIPSDLFNGVTGGTESMFESTFSGCAGLTGSIPANLFSGVSVDENTYAYYMFYGTFWGCSGLSGTIPANLFSGVTYCEEGIFDSTFYGCSNLTGYVPLTLFPESCNVYDTFVDTGLNTTCPSNMVPYKYYDDKVSCVEPFITPIVLDNQNATTPAVPSSLYLKYRTGWYLDANATTEITRLTTLPTKTGSTFGGFWNETNGEGLMVIDTNGEFLDNSISRLSDQNLTLYAYWPKTYTVTYDCGDGNGSAPSTTTVMERDQFTPAANTCSRDGYMFLGWNISDTDTTVQPGKSITWIYDEDKTFTAQWAEEKFSITTTSISTNGTFQFYMSAKGTFYVDCGENGTLSGSYASGNVIDRSYSTSNVLYTCTYDTSGVKTVRFGGRATGYSTGTNANAAAIRFSVTPTLVASISGSLGAIFPTVGASTSSYPRFWNTFYGCTNLAGSIPENLFDGVTGTTTNMFNQTFYNCRNLSGYVPTTLFSGITSYSTNMMNNIFYDTGLATTCPAGTEQYYTGFESYWNSKVACGPETPNPSWNLGTAKFGVTTANLSANTKFELSISAKGNFTIDWGDGTVETLNRSNTTTNTTYSHTYTTGGKYMIKLDGLATGYNTGTTTPTIKFITTGITGLYGSLGALFPTVGTSYPRFYQTFYNCTGLSGSIPANLFDGVTGSVSYMFYQTFYNCSGLTGSIPAGLFGGVTGIQTYLFYQTFYGCSGLSGSIPETLFSGVTGSAQNYMFYNTFGNCTNLSGYIPPRLFEGLTRTTASQFMTGIFNKSGISTTCPNGTTQYYTGFEDPFFQDKVSCTEPFVTQVILDDQSADTTSVPTTVYVKYGTGWYSNSAGTTAISQLTTNPTKTGMRFDGYWTTTNGGGVQVIDDTGHFITSDATTKISKLTDSDVTIYANWVNDYTVTYSCGDGAGTPPATVTATTGKNFTPALSTGCYKDGYILSEWLVSNAQSNNNKKTTGGTFVWDYNENKTFTAQWVESKFEVQTINLNPGDNAAFNFGARGTFYVDWDDGVTYKVVCSDAYVSCTGTNGSYSGNATRTVCRVINTDTGYSDFNKIPHEYSNGGVHTIRFGGVATSYRDTVQACSITTGQKSAILFNNQTWLARILPGGNLSALFPHFGMNTNQAVRFEDAFYGCTNLSSIPADMFDGYTVPTSSMFNRTFQECTSLTSIPSELFGDLTGAPAGSMFQETFRGCTGLTAIPSGLFSSISGAPASQMFYSTFSGCSGLTGPIPGNLFAGISGAPATEMFSYTFSGCSGLTGSIPAGLFSGISGAPAEGMFSGTFYGCSGLTGSIPENLFAGISGAPATYMFSATFYGCRGLTGSIPNRLFGNLSGYLSANKYYFSGTFNGATNLSGYVPATLFSGLTGSTNNTMTNIFADTGLETSCPPCYSQYITGFESAWSGKVACQVGLDEDEFFYNDVCTTLCKFGGTKLMVGNGLEFQILSSRVTTPALNIRFSNNDICYVPLEVGNGGSGSLNISYGGQTYHAGTLPVEPD